MPVLDMPLHELHQYQGCSPRMPDFDAYWQQALSELDGVQADVTLTPAEFQAPFAECFDLYFTGVDGARVYAKYLRPKGAAQTERAPACANAGPSGGATTCTNGQTENAIDGQTGRSTVSNCPVVLQFHGYTGSSGDWTDKLPLVAAGFCVAALDCRGQGGRSQDIGGVQGNTLNGHILRGAASGSRHLLYRSIYLDAVQLARIVGGFSETDAARINTVGASQGGALALACAALVPEIKKTVAIYPFLCDFKRVYNMDLCQEAYVEFTEYFRRFDPRHEREAALFETVSYIDIQNLTPRIQSHVLMATGLMDSICPPSTQFAAYNKIQSQKESIIYPDFGHDGLPGMEDKIFQFLMEK